MTLHQLRLFYTVAQWLSFSAAARELSLSQPAVSLQIQTLEKSVGVRLFSRSGNKLTLTLAGEALLRSVETMLQAEDEARRVVDELRTGSEREIKLAVEASCLYAVAPLLREFRAANSGVRVRLDVDSPERIMTAIQREAIDGGFVRSTNVDRRTLSQVVADDELVLVASLDNPLGADGPIDPKVLEDEALIFPLARAEERVLIDEALGGAGIVLRPAMELPSMEAIRMAVAANLGVGFAFAGAVRSDIDARVLRRVTVNGLDLPCPIELVHGPPEQFSGPAKRLYDVITSQRAPERLSASA